MNESFCVCVYLCMYVCMCVLMYVYMFVCMYVCIYVWHICLILLYVVCTVHRRVQLFSLCMYARKYVCNECMHVCMYVGDVITVPVFFRDHSDDAAGGLGHPSIEALDNAYDSAVLNGMPPKALLLTNPNNPTGEVYPAAELRLMARWCRQKNIHLISDEIYALSVFQEQGMYVCVYRCLYVCMYVMYVCM